MRFLVVEDQSRAGHILQEALARGGRASVELVASLEGAIAAVQQESYDAIAMDLAIPATHRLGGLEQMLDAAGDVPIVVITATSEETLTNAALNLGAEDFFVYDVGQINELYVRLMQANARRHATSRLEGGHFVRERDALVRHFLNEASHELRTPLTTVGAAQQLLKQGDLNTIGRQRLARNLERLKQSIEDFLGVLPHPAIEAVTVYDVLEAARGTAQIFIPQSDVVIIGERNALERALRLSFRIATAASADVHVAVERSSSERLHVRIRFPTATHPQEEHPILMDVIRRMAAETMGFFTASLRDGEATLDISLPAMPAPTQGTRAPHPIYTT